MEIEMGIEMGVEMGIRKIPLEWPQLSQLITLSG